MGNHNVYLSAWVAGFPSAKIKARLFRISEARRQDFLSCAVKVVFIQERQA